MSRPSSSRRVGRYRAVGALAEESTYPASSIYSWIASGKLPCYRIGRSVRVAEEDWIQFMKSQREVRS